MNLRALTYAFALCSLSMSAAEAQSIRCTHKHTGKRTTAYCDTLTPQIIALAKHAYAACGAYVTKGADISSLAQKGFVRGKTRYPQFYAKAPNEFTKKPTSVAAYVQKGRCGVGVSTVTFSDGHELSDVMFAAMKQYGFQKKLRKVNNSVAEPTLTRSGRVWDMSFQLPMREGVVSFDMSLKGQ